MDNKQFSKLGKILAISLPLMVSMPSCKKTEYIKGTVEINRKFTDLFSREEKRNIVIDPLEYHKSSFLISYDTKELDKEYKEKLRDVSKGDTLMILKKYSYLRKHDPEYKILFNR